MKVNDRYCRELLNECWQRFQFQYPERAYLDGVTPQQVKAELKAHRKVYLRLQAHPVYDRAAAYVAIRRMLAAGESPDLLVHYDDVRLWDKLADARVGPQRLPRWLRQELKSFLSLLQRMKTGWTSPIPTPLTPEFVGPIKLFTARCYLDLRVLRAVKLLRRRWRITQQTDPLAWYQRMNDADIEAENYKHSDHRRGRTARSFFLARIPPSDPRNLGTYSDHELGRTGLPLADYLRDLGVLVWLLGGSPADSTWVRWAEGLLWDFRSLPWPGFVPKEPPLERWRGYPKSAPLNISKSTRVWAAPIFNGPTVRSDNGQVTVTFSSKYLALDGLEGSLRTSVIAAACAVWGDYEERLPLLNIERQMQAMLRPHSRREVYSADIDDVPDEELGDLDDREFTAARQRRRRHVRSI